MSSINHAGEHTDFAGIQALSSRAPGYAVAQKCLEMQSAAEKQDPSLRTKKRTVLAEAARSWYVGALGEIEVGRILSTLGPEWFVRHAVPIGAGTKDVDHLVIGPTGVFAINTKHHSGARIWVGDHELRVNNQKKHHLKAAHSDGVDVSQRLGNRLGFPVPVISLIVMLHPRSINDRRQITNRPVGVIDARQLLATIKAQPALLSETKLSLIKLAAEEPETWHVDPRAADTLRVMQRFERLVDQVGGRPVAPVRTAGPSRPGGPARVRTPELAKAQRNNSKPRSARTTSSIADLVKVWLTIAAIVAGILVFRAWADQPCADGASVGCVFSYTYLGLKPLLVFALIGSVTGGGIFSLIWFVRRALRP